MTISLCGVTGGNPLHAHVTPYVCPICTDDPGRAGDGGRCYHCSGNILTDDPLGDEPPVKAPRPPAVMKAPCVDCAYRPGSPEDGILNSVGEEVRPNDPRKPFFCHHGMHRVGTYYVPAAECNGMPLGYMVCAGWWNHVVEGGARPERPFRDPGGSDRSEKRET